MKTSEIFKYKIGDKAYTIRWASEEKICECCGQTYETDPEPIGTQEVEIAARKLIEDIYEEKWETSGIFYRVITEKRNGTPIWFRNVCESDLFDTPEEAEQHLKELQNES